MDEGSVEVTNAPQAILEQFADASFEAHFGKLSPGGASYLWSAITASLSVGALLGCFISVPLSEYFGIKKALMLVNNGILFTGCLFFVIAKPANSWECLVLGKIALGIYSGIAMSLQTAYIQEAAPKEFRGPISCFVHIGMTVGSALGAAFGTGAFLGTPTLWPYLLAFPAVFGIPQIFLVSAFKESPKFLHRKEPYSNEAEASIYFYYGPDVDTREVLDEYEAEDASVPAQITIWDCMLSPEYRNRLLIGALVNFVQIFTGLMAIVSYSTAILTQIGLSEELSQYATAVGAFLGLLSSFPVIWLINLEGRRRMLLWTLMVIDVVLFSFVILGTLMEKGIGGIAPGVLFIIACVIFLAAYNLGPGPIAYFIAGTLQLVGLGMTGRRRDAALDADGDRHGPLLLRHPGNVDGEGHRRHRARGQHFAPDPAPYPP